MKTKEKTKEKTIEEIEEETMKEIESHWLPGNQPKKKLISDSTPSTSASSDQKT